MSGAALETLAIVAYKQPISRAQVASIRGVDPDGVLRTLQARGYITEVARDSGPGQAILFGTTPSFLEKLGLDSLADLPPIAEFVPGPEVVEALEHGLRVEPTDDHDGADAHRRPLVSRPNAAGNGRGDRVPEPPLWEQWAAASAALPQGERLQKVLATRAGAAGACARS